MGDLDAYESRLLFQRTVEDFLSLYDIRPQVVVHDLHPDYFTTHLARQLAEKWNIPSAAESSATATSPRASSPPWNPTPAPPSSTPNSPPTDGNLSIGQLWSAARNRASQS
ncbi:MAG TPA: hypothetical protein VLU25_01370 [Acidobacteriota bacterium]|nr:hypothetical protein [Acidobacteriota bacterium]